jgi:hypothetical protein
VYVQQMVEASIGIMFSHFIYSHAMATTVAPVQLSLPQHAFQSGLPLFLLKGVLFPSHAAIRLIIFMP